MYSRNLVQGGRADGDGTKISSFISNLKLLRVILVAGLGCVASHGVSLVVRQSEHLSARWRTPNPPCAVRSACP